MVVNIQTKTEQLSLDVARKLIGWEDASRQGDTEGCQRLETEIFELVENNGLSQEWLELFACLAADDREKVQSTALLEK